MPSEELRQLTSGADAWTFWTDPLMWSCVVIVGLGHVARVFKMNGPVVWRVLFAETVMAMIGAVGIYAGAEMQGMDVLQKIGVSVMMSLGGIHTIQRAVQAWTTLRGGGS